MQTTIKPAIADWYNVLHTEDWHHFEFHTIGPETFAEKYHFHGIKLKDEDIVNLKLMSWKQIHEFDEEYRRNKNDQSSSINRQTN